MQQFARPGEMLPASGIGEQPIVADAVKAAGQHVQQEAAHELVGTERHGLVARLPRGAVILPAEGDAPFVEGQQSLVRDHHSAWLAAGAWVRLRRQGSRFRKRSFEAFAQAESFGNSLGRVVLKPTQRKEADS